MHGSLGVPNLMLWNQACNLKHLWHLFTDSSESIWWDWFRKNLVRGKQFWILKIAADTSWSQRNLLNLRQLAQERIKVAVGNGVSTSVWFDNWHSVGPLFKLVNPIFITSYEVSANVIVEGLIRGISQDWPHGDFWRQLESQTPTRFHYWPNREDQLIWMSS